MPTKPQNPSQRIFQAGGSLEHHSASYIERNADVEALHFAMDGELINLISPHHTGKTSLLKRLKWRLEESGWLCVYIDFRLFRDLEKNSWYHELGQRIGLVLAPNVLPQVISASTLETYIRRQFDDADSSTQKRVVLFLDSLEAVGQALDTVNSTAFFATWRGLYNEREQMGKRLTLVLSGVVNPATLIKSTDASISPFDVGKKVNLADFNDTELETLTDLLGNLPVRIAEDFLPRLRYWTDGSPYLAQRICSEIESMVSPTNELEANQTLVDQSVKRLFINVPTVKVDPNIEYVRQSFRRFDNNTREIILRLTKHKVLQINQIHNADSRYTLWLSGITNEHESEGQVRIRNKIYHDVLTSYLSKTRKRHNFWRPGIVGLMTALAVGAVFIMSVYGWPTQYSTVFCSSLGLQLTTRYPVFLATGDIGTIELVAHNQATAAISATVVIDLSSRAAPKTTNHVEFSSLEPDETRLRSFEFERAAPPHWFWHQDDPILLSPLVRIDGIPQFCTDTEPVAPINAGPVHGLKATWLWLVTTGLISWILMVPSEWLKELAKRLAGQSIP